MSRSLAIIGDVNSKAWGKSWTKYQYCDSISQPVNQMQSES